MAGGQVRICIVLHLVSVLAPACMRVGRNREWPMA